MRRVLQLVRHGFELGGAVSLLGSVGAGGALAAIAAFVSDFPLGLRIVLAVSVFLLVAAAILAMVGWFKTRPQGASENAPAIVGGGVYAGRDSYVAGRDVTVGAHVGPTHDERVRYVRREIKQILKRLDQLDARLKPPDDWNTVWPPRNAPYPPLPMGQWETHGDALTLPTIERDAIDRAYALAEDFNDGLSAWLARDAFSSAEPAEPDLAAMRAAFVRADAALAARRTDES